MKDFPVFTTDYGVASLTLKEIPYRETAYIRILATEQPEELLKECVSFCRVCGAEHIYATGHEVAERYPLYTAVLEMRGDAWVDTEKLENLFPVTEQTVTRWRGILNERMRNVDNAATLEACDESRVLASAGAYFVHHAGDLLGVGWIEDEKILAVAAVKPGAGERVVHTLMSVLEGESMTLEVASTNERAIRLYKKLGFTAVREISRWYRIC